ncbi:MAG: branched-chain amino acid aminotransferase [Alphaproteobacteria bacterium]|nr:branched-chain amino acid aminotransferase [Alphaproteobacteria bacterium]
MTAPPPPTSPFGTVFAPKMTVSRWKDGAWSTPDLVDVGPMPFHPATHVFHYGSACFEGLKAHRGHDDVVRIFRLDRHAARMQQSADLLMLPQPGEAMLSQMVVDAVAANKDHVPQAPGSLYLRPTLIGTEPNIGAAGTPSKEALLYVLCSPVGDYFAGGVRPLKIAIETEHPRTTPAFGRVKCGANYVMALGITQRAKKALGVDQVLFAPDGDVQETGASNFLLLDDTRIVTKALDESFLHGVTRDSILTLARDLGYTVEERDVSVDEVIAWAAKGEAALSGTAAVMSSVGTLVYRGEEIPVGGGGIGPNATKLRQALTALHVGKAEDRHGWTRAV